VNLLAMMAIPHIHRLKKVNLSRATVKETDLEEFANRDWPNHPAELILPRGGELHDLRSRITLLFSDWVSFAQW
jgi:hypothetical protein